MTRRWKASAFPFEAADKVPATLDAVDVTGNLPANVKQWDDGALPEIPEEAPTAAQVYQYFVDGSRPDPFKASGYATPTNVTDAKTEILTAIGQVKAPGGSDAVAITVESDGTPVQNAVVTLHDGPQIVSQEPTNADGLANLTADPGDCRLSVLKQGYLAYSDDITVESGGHAGTVEVMRIEVSPPAAPNLTTGYVLCTTNGVAAEGVTIRAQMYRGPGDAGQSPSRAEITFTSDSNGMAEYTGFIRGATYTLARGTDGLIRDAQGRPGYFVAPNEPTWALPEILGQP